MSTTHIDGPALLPGRWYRLTRPVASWLRLSGLGTIEADDLVFAQRSAVRADVRSTTLSKAAGEGQPLALSKGPYVLHLRFDGEHWEACWGSEAPIQYIDNPALLFDRDAVPLAPAPLAAPEAPAPNRPTPAPSPRKGPPAWVAAFLAPTLLLAAMAGVTAYVSPEAGGLPHAQEVAEHCEFDEGHWLDGKPHTLCTHAFRATQWAELLYLGAGVVLFGWLAARNVGFWRTLLLFVWSAAASVGLWRFLHTPLGHDMFVNVLGKAIGYVAEKFGPDAGLGALLVFQQAYAEVMAFRGPVCGALGAVAGLIAFASLRRDLSGKAAPRWAGLLLGAGFLAGALLWAWPELLGKAAPLALLVGGLAGGVAFCLPDMALEHFWGELKDALARRSQS